MANVSRSRYQHLPSQHKIIVVAGFKKRCRLREAQIRVLVGQAHIICRGALTAGITKAASGKGDMYVGSGRSGQRRRRRTAPRSSSALTKPVAPCSRATATAYAKIDIPGGSGREECGCRQSRQTRNETVAPLSSAPNANGEVCEFRH